MSDCWSSYAKIHRLNNDYVHDTVNHDLQFVCSDYVSIHTNGIESVWNTTKIHIKVMRGVSRKYLNSYLNEVIWRRNKV